ncbi:MAG: M23 family metallopeptidase [Spirochaetaceae bacterium]|jgi:LysM repeat protein|nr:M23 family metallopeptidase [Spirochaetaceae bacterium]
MLFADDETIHVLKSGETIYGLAREYGVKVEEILFINGIEDARRVQSGQRIRIPDRPTMVSPVNLDPNAPAVELYNVQKGDTFFGISRRYGVPLPELTRVNNLPENYVLKTGDVLKIPIESQNTDKTQLIAEAPVLASISEPPRPGSEVNLSLIWPINPKEASYMTGKLSGVAIVGEQSEGVYCIFPGTVISAGPYRGFGRVVIVKSIEGYLYVYGGCETLFVKAGDTVATGMELGRLGIDAVSGQAALFFMVYLNNAPVDPATAPRD